MSGGIYVITCLANNAVYVGSAKNFQSRFTAHLCELANGNHRNPHMQRAYDKYGKESFQFSEYLVLGEYDKELYFAEENKVMDEFRIAGQRLFNIAKAEGGWTYATVERKEEIGEKISKSLKETASRMTVEERKAKYGKGKKDVPLSEERKQQLSEYWSGKPKSVETKKQMSEAQKNNPANRENGRRVGLSNKGKSPPNIRKVMVDGIIFNSLKEAAEHFNVTSSAIHGRIRRDKNGKNGYIT